MGEPSETPDVLFLDEAAKLMRMSTKTLVKLAKGGAVPGRQLSGRSSPWRFSRRALLATLEAIRVDPAA